MKKTIEFWKERLWCAQIEHQKHKYQLQACQWQLEIYYRMKLKKIPGHKLFENCFSDKVYRRRKLWLKRRNKLLARAGFHRREMKRIQETKINFFQKRIQDLS